MAIVIPRTQESAVLIDCSFIRRDTTEEELTIEMCVQGVVCVGAEQLCLLRYTTLLAPECVHQPGSFPASLLQGFK